MWGWVLVVVLGVAGVIMYVVSGDTKDEQDHRAQVWGTLLTALVVVPPVLVWGWTRSRVRPEGASTAGQVEAAADQLATRMLHEWSRQAVARGIQLPAPVRVRWQWAGPEVAGDRQEVNEFGSLGTDPSPMPGTTSGQVLSSGLVTRLHDRVYARLRHGRLVLIGGPGAGKTGAMIMLLLEALQHRGRVPASERTRVPVPVWLTLGSWDPHTQGVHEWVSATLARDHPYLQAVDYGPDAIAQLLREGRVALFLDGLDEMPNLFRRRALHRLTGEAAGIRVVLSSRPVEYQDAIQDDGIGLPYAAVIDLQPVGPQTAADYLLAGRTGRAQLAWQHVTDQLQADPEGVLARTLTTPLTLSLARALGPDPAWLSSRIHTEQDLRDQLLDQTLITAYPEPGRRAHATRWLGWIAHHMGTPHDPSWTRDLAWWQIPTWIQRRHLKLLAGLVFGLLVGLVVGLVVGLMVGLVFGLVGGLVVGLEVGLVVGLVVALVVGPKPPRQLTVRWPTRGELRTLRRFVVGLVLVGEIAGGLVGALGVGLWGGLGVGVAIGSGFGLVVGSGVGLVVGLVDGVWARPIITSSSATPRSIYYQDVRVQAFSGLGVGLMVGLGLGIEFWLVSGIVVGSVVGLVGGLVVGLGVGLVVGLAGGSAPSLWLLEVLFRLQGKRVRFLPLLEDALRSQVLRQAGAVYQFRHADLQDRLTHRYRSDHPMLAPGSALPSDSIDIDA